MSRFEKFAAERDVMERIEQLRTDGFKDEEITVISKQKLEYAYLKFRDVNFKNSEGTTWDKFVSMFSDDDPVDKVLREFDITDSEREHFKDALERKEILLLKNTYGFREEGHVQSATPEFHETQQQDAQGLETEAEQNTRMDAQKVTPKPQSNYSYNQQSGYSYDHGTESEHDRLHTAEDDDRFDSLHSSKASSRGAGGSAPVGPTYEEQADRAMREDITLDAERDPVEQDEDITLKDTDTARSNEYGYGSKTNVRDKKPLDFDKNEYSYDKKPGKDYNYK